MKRLKYLTPILLAFASMAPAQMFYNNTAFAGIIAEFITTDEIADDTPFTGRQHVSSFTFEYLNLNAVPVNAVVRFYTVDPSTGGVGSLVAIVPVSNLVPGFEQIVTVNLDPSQEFDWVATGAIYNRRTVSGGPITGGFVSMQFDSPKTGWYEAGFASLDGFLDLTTGQFITFGGDTAASFYLQVSGAPTAPVLSALSVNPATVQGGRDSQGTVTLTNPAPPGGVAVKLFSGNPSLAEVPTGVTIPAGSTTASFRIKTKGVKTASQVMISASSNGVLKVAGLTLVR